ncbi:hypothetical protein P7K49_038869, partial [Saguinus oedipus]
ERCPAPREPTVLRLRPSETPASATCASFSDTPAPPFLVQKMVVSLGGGAAEARGEGGEEGPGSGRGRGWVTACYR